MSPASSDLFAMAGFALASSISPGPVNLLTLRAGALRGLGSGLRMAWGATLGFTALLLLAGLGLQSLWSRWPALQGLLHGGGIAFLLWMAWQLARDEGQLSAEESRPAGRDRGAWVAALAQWLNPKAWLAALAGVGLFVNESARAHALLHFALLYAGVCLLSMACWAVAGAWLGARVRGGAGLRRLNRGLALLLLICAVGILAQALRPTI